MKQRAAEQWAAVCRQSASEVSELNSKFARATSNDPTRMPHATNDPTSGGRPRPPGSLRQVLYGCDADGPKLPMMFLKFCMIFKVFHEDFVIFDDFLSFH